MSSEHLKDYSDKKIAKIFINQSDVMDIEIHADNLFFFLYNSDDLD